MEITEIYPHFKTFSWNQFIVRFFSEKNTLTEFLLKSRGGEIFKITTLCTINWKIRETNVQKKVEFTKFFQCDNYGNFLSHNTVLHFFGINFVKTTPLQILIIINECPCVLCAVTSLKLNHQFWWNFAWCLGMFWSGFMPSFSSYYP